MNNLLLFAFTVVLRRNFETSEGIFGPVDGLTLRNATSCIHRWNHVQSDWTSFGLIAQPYLKSAHAYVDDCLSIVMQNNLLTTARNLIGTSDLILATMSVIVKKPGWEHRWHSDVENVIDGRKSCTSRSWTAWLPISGTTRGSSMHFVTHTHESTTMAQTHLPKQCKVCVSADWTQWPNITARGEWLVKNARENGLKDAEHVMLDAHDGEAWFFRGTTW